jgi:hypothetical protein
MSINCSPMRRCFLIVFSLSPSLLLVVTISLWIHSYWSDCGIMYERSTGSSGGILRWTYWIQSLPGGITVGVLTYDGSRLDRSSALFLTGALIDLVGSRQTRSLWNHIGVYFTDKMPHISWVRAVTLPFWMPALIFGSLSWWGVRHLRRVRLRQMAGCCLSCGYDLRASPLRCPECGKLIDGQADRTSGA